MILKEAIDQIVNYLYDDEQQHYQLEPNGAHIFLAIKKLKDYAKTL